jgi:hypothetical protein
VLLDAAAILFGDGNEQSDILPFRGIDSQGDMTGELF